LFGCASAVKQQTLLDSTYQVKVKSKKSNMLSVQTAITEEVIDKYDNYHLGVKLDRESVKFAVNYADEHVYFIDKFLRGDFKGDGELGDAHTISPLSRLSYFVSTFDEPMLGVKHCSFGYCKDTQGLYFDRSQAQLLKKQIVDFQARYARNLEVFKVDHLSMDKSLLYIYRLNSAPLALDTEVQVDSTNIVLPRNTCFGLYIDSGKIEIQAKGFFGNQHSTEMSINAEKGEATFVQVTTNVKRKGSEPDYGINAMMDIFSDRKYLRQVPMVVAKYDLNKCELLN